MPKLNYKTLRQEVVDEIRQKILGGEFKPGDRMKENEIAELFGVSRGPVREALRQIEQEGLVRYERNVGCSVAAVTEQDIYEVCLLRATLEILAVRLNKGNFSAESLQQMRESLERMKALEDDLYQLAQEDNYFHSRIIEQTGFRKIEHVWKSMNVNNFAIFCAIDKQSVKDSYQRHLDLFTCYEQGDAEAMVEELKRHYDVGAGSTTAESIVKKSNQESLASILAINADLCL